MSPPPPNHITRPSNLIYCGWIWCVVTAWWVLGKEPPGEPIPLQVKHVAVEFVEPFRPSGPCLRTMKISAQWCRVDTRYFTHNWETRGGRERRPSRIGPKDRPTALGPVHQVWPKPSCKAQWKGEEDKADKGRGGKTTSGNGQAWSSESPRGQWRTGKNGENWLQNHLWCPNDPLG